MFRGCLTFLSKNQILEKSPVFDEWRTGANPCGDYVFLQCLRSVTLRDPMNRGLKVNAGVNGGSEHPGYIERPDEQGTESLERP